MNRIPTTGRNGLNGWTVEPEELDAYLEHMARHWNFLGRLWYWLQPLSTHCVAYSRPDGRVAIMQPTRWMVAMLKRGDVIRHMRVVDHYGPQGIPVFEGSGEFLPPMSEREAVEFIAWKDIPREVNHRVVLTASDIPQDRSRRNEWRLGDCGIELPV